MRKSVSIIIPAFNDEATLEGSVKSVLVIAKKLFSDYELLIFDDGSTDRTADVVDMLAKNPRIRAFHNPKNMNVGYSYRKGINAASKDYVMLLPGPDSLTVDSLEFYMGKIGQADIVTSHSSNREVRLRHRLVISAIASAALNFLFALRLKYYFGMQMYKTSLVRKVRITTNSFGVYPEILIQLVKAGHSVREVPIQALPETNSTTALRWNNIRGIVSVVVRLFFRVHFRLPF
ncbi:glycosyltransferase family 2 protein [Candidatus Woesearchaeota archaeon]|nr:glycosyltransferase family 2 protein [Candidatus Woesearchaeota archaeon]